MWPFSTWGEARFIRETVATKREARAEAIATTLKGLPAVPATDDQEYLSADATSIAAKIRSKEWSARRVVEAYIRSAARAHSRTNCLTEIMFEQALAEAQDLDTRIKSAPQEELDSMLLIGVPMSLKDQIDYKGVDNSRGFVRYCNDPVTEDSSLVKVLRNAGAIPFCKTNVPQTMLAFECSNPVFGRTVNPYSPDHTCGGSSGGEAALLALDGSALGIGSDIGGSLRIPTAYSGCFAIKPVAGRFPTVGIRGVVPGYEAIRTTLGPMGRTIADVELCMRVVADASVSLSGSHHGLLPMPYREATLPTKLRIGYFVEDPLIPTTPACKRAVDIAVEAARAAGHDCVPIQLPDPIAALEIFQALASSDAFRTLTSHLLSKEPQEPALFLPIFGARIPSWLRSFVLWGLRKFTTERHFARVAGASGEKRVAVVWKWQHARDEYAQKVKKYLWEDLKLDTVICPVQASPAVPHGSTKRLSPLAIQTIYWNVVDSTVGVIPVTRVDPALDTLTTEEKQAKIAEAGSRLLAKEYYETVYDTEAMQGLPVGVQIVGPAWHEEKVIEMMKTINGLLIDRQGVSFGPCASSPSVKS